MAQSLKGPKPWNPYLAGALSGLLLVASVWGAGKFFGASTSFVRTAGMIEKSLDAQRVLQVEYFLKTIPKIDWQWMFVAGILVGSLASSRLSGTFRLQSTPDMWRARFGASVPKRASVAFIGGVIAMFGARLAGG